MNNQHLMSPSYKMKAIAAMSILMGRYSINKLKGVKALISRVNTFGVNIAP